MTQATFHDHGRLGELLRKAGLLNAEQVTRVMHAQSESGLRFGETAVQLGLLTEEQIRLALAQQFRYAVSATPQSGVAPSLAIAHAPFSEEAEAIRRIRTQLSLHYNRYAQLVFAVVSPRDGEGKSYLAASLAIAFSQAGLRTLFIDADMRRSDGPNPLGVRQSTGLSAMLAGHAVVEASQPLPDFPLLQVIDRGPRPPNPSEILGTASLQRLLQSFEYPFDACVVDTPSINGSVDAQIIARQLGSCVLVARQHVSSLRELKNTRAQLVSAGVEIAGVVYNSFQGRTGLLAGRRAARQDGPAARGK